MQPKLITNLQSAAKCRTECIFLMALVEVKHNQIKSEQLKVVGGNIREKVYFNLFFCLVSLRNKFSFIERQILTWIFLNATIIFSHTNKFFCTF